MSKLTLLVAIVAMASAGCKKKPADSGPTNGSAEAMGGSAMAGSGSAAGSAEGSGSAGSAAEAKPLTAEDLTKRFDECWGFFNDIKWDEFKGCYADDATYELPGSGQPAATGPDKIIEMAKQLKTEFPDMKGEAMLELLNGHDLVAVMLAGTMNTPGAKQKFGLLVAQDLQLSDDGKAKKVWEYEDTATMMGQLKPDPKHPVRPVVDKLPMEKQVVIAKDDDAEKANLETEKKMIEAFNKHDAKALEAMLTDDAVWSEQALPRDTAKKANLKSTKQLWKTFPDAKLDPSEQWAAGDFVVTVGTLEGTSAKKAHEKISLPFLEADQLEKAKVKHTWLFYQSLALMKQLGTPGPGEAGAKGHEAPRR